MAEAKKIIIEIIDSSNSSSGGEGESESPLIKLLPQEEKPKQKKKKSAEEIYLIHSAKRAVQTLGNSISLSINRYFSLQEDYLAENLYSNVKTAIGKAESLYGSIKAGGLALGPAGMLIGGVMWSATEALSQHQRYSNYYAQLNATNAQTEFSQKRAGLYDNGRGTEN